MFFRTGSTGSTSFFLSEVYLLHDFTYRLHDFTVNIPRCYKDVLKDMVQKFELNSEMARKRFHVNHIKLNIDVIC